MMFKKDKVGVVIVAAGKGERMGGTDKMFVPLVGEPLLKRTVGVFEGCALIDQIVVVLGKHNIEKGRQLRAKAGWKKVITIRIGGARRQDSVAVGLKELRDCKWVVIHDGARPLVTENVIKVGLDVALESGAAACAVPLRDTIKMVGDDGFVIGTPPRQKLWMVQTPQVFHSAIINEAHQKSTFEVTDDASLVERTGGRVKLYAGSYENIKITTVEDLALAELLWQKREN
jgi:2-C-methyl-D-erythritol 4-phosphate cytidylyltransferase